MLRQAALQPAIAAEGRGLRRHEQSIAVAGSLLAGLIGLLLAADLPIGLVLLGALAYAPLVVTNLRLGIALFVPMLFMQGVPALNLGGKVAGLMIALSWLGSWRTSREVIVAALDRHRRLLTVLLTLVLWMTLSLAWADDTAAGSAELYPWWGVAVLFVVVATTVNSGRAARLVAWGFLAGAVISSIAGMIDGSLSGSSDGAARVTGGVGDPNFLAASIVAAAVLAAGLLPGTRSPARRLLIVAAIVVLVVALVGTASRGGTLAAGVALISAFFVFRRQRRYVIAVAGIVLGIAALTFANSPAAFERVTNFDNDNGRSDLWSVAWEMGKDHPVIGVGLDNYRAHATEYARQPGTIEQVTVVAEIPHFVHNTFLELFAEGGVVALTLFVAITCGSLVTAKRAGDELEKRGNPALATLTRAMMVATFSTLGASMFLSATLDLRLWLLLALGPAMMGVARHAPGNGLGIAEPGQTQPAGSP